MHRLNPPSLFWLLTLLLGGWALGAGHSRALAQNDSASIGEIDLRVERFGPGNVCRQGEWVGLYVAMDDRGLEQRDVILRVQGRDADGDRPLYDTVVTSNPGTRQAFWLYTRLPFRFDQNDSLKLSVWSAEDSGDRDESGALAYRATRQLASTSFRPARVLDKTESMIGVLGPWHFGLGAYGVAPTTGAATHSLLGHELTRIVSGLEHAEIPNSYQGLMQFDALVWGAARRDADPLRLTTDQSRAIREWVTRGGHLIVVLPSVGQEWFSRANPLSDLLPTSMPGEQVEGFDLSTISALLSRSEDALLPSSASIRVLESAQPDPVSAHRVLETPDGACVVSRRIVGAGAVTVIGIDLSNPALVSSGLPDTDVFWHRVLGRRGDLDPNSKAVSRAKPAQRNRRTFDSDIPDEIAKSGRAYVGVLLGFVVFALYWVVAGPGGFGLLARSKKKHHAWVAFVAAIGVFTAIAWTGATLIRPKRTEAVHLTFLHQVHGQETQRARTWASVLIPSYGEATISVGEDGEGGSRSTMTGLVSPWEPPQSDAITQSSFPDNRAYRVDARSPDSMRVPTRSTIKQIRADWAGTPGWGSIEALREPGQIDGRLITLGEQGVARGRIAHSFPGALAAVTILVVQRQHRIPRPGFTIQSQPVCVANAYTLNGEWAPGEGAALSLESVTAPQSTLRSRERLEEFSSSLLREGKLVAANLGRTRVGDVGDRMKGVLLFPQLAPPTFTGSGAGEDLAQRSETHGLDLSHWFTQPCVIVIGHLTDPGIEDLPIPLRVNGRPVRSGEGRTVVSWVYPLAASPPSYVPEFEDEQADPEASDP